MTRLPANGRSSETRSKVPTHGEALFHVIVEYDQEGIVATRREAPYRAGRQGT